MAFHRHVSVQHLKACGEASKRGVWRSKKFLDEHLSHSHPRGTTLVEECLGSPYTPPGFPAFQALAPSTPDSTIPPRGPRYDAVERRQWRFMPDPAVHPNSVALGANSHSFELNKNLRDRPGCFLISSPSPAFSPVITELPHHTSFHSNYFVS